MYSFTPFKVMITSGFAAQSLRDCGSAYLTKLENSRFATVTSQQSLRDCDSTYLTKWGNSRFATVALHI